MTKTTTSGTLSKVPQAMLSSEEESDEHEDGTEGYESLTSGDFSHAA